MGLQLYKIGQGRYLRAGTGVAVALVDLVVAYYLYTLLLKYVADTLTYKVYLAYGIPAVLFAGLGVAAFFYMNRPNVVDFLVATESEMKKVSWSSRAELLGSTGVVILTVVALADLIFLLDFMITGGLAGGVFIRWSDQDWLQRFYTGIHVVILLAALFLVVSALVRRRAATPESGRGLAFTVAAAASLVAAAAWCYGWFESGIHLPGLGVW
ncbi:MAG TPA: preprotein translocase subunit SecE [Phycisphaerae bacterium]|nr:preprotein translocase subunit SecE [Phycisphaerae bacterium]